MDITALATQLKQWGVKPPDIYRASLYLDYLQNARDFFFTTLNTPAQLDAGYSFVQAAVRAPSLLTELAEVLDHFVTVGVELDFKDQYNNHGHGSNGPNPWTYSDYFNNMIFNSNDVTYQNNVAAFRTRYPLTAHALGALSANFQNNIATCCQRVINDTVTLQSFFGGLFPGSFTINSLTNIKSTGSDFHKGGQQVLILTFSGTDAILDHSGDLQIVNTTLKVVYKPGDVEADCLIAGNSAAINSVTTGAPFMAKSLFEIYNDTVDAVKASTPGFTGEHLDTYRILPINYNSKHGNGLPLPIRAAYGYIQYLNYDLYFTALHFWGVYPTAISDYMIFRGQNADSIIGSFYRKTGAFCALAATFSVLDLHIENFRVNNYHPVPIDLEVSLSSVVTDIKDTLLISKYGALNTNSKDDSSFVWKVTQKAAPGTVAFKTPYETDYYTNRLYAWKYESVNSGPDQFMTGKRLVPINNFYLLQGYNDGMTVLRQGQMNNAFNAWLTRLNNVTVRYLAVTSNDYIQIIKSIFYDQLSQTAKPLDALIDDFLTNKLNIELGKYINGAPPDFLGYTVESAKADLLNMDIPVFYYCIGAASTNIVNSNGNQVTIPATYPGKIGRTTFFANSPTETEMKPQLTVLGGSATQFEARRLLIRTTINTALGIDAVPANPGNLIPETP